MSELLQRVTRHWLLAAVLVGVPLFILLLYGCESRPPIVMTSGGGGNAADQCSVLLESGIDMVRPQSLGLVGPGLSLRNSPADAAETLSQWLRRPDCRTAAPAEPLSDEARALLTRLLGSEGATRLTAERLAPFDAAFLRDALLEFSAADALSRGANNDIERALRLFDYVTRTISPEGAVSVDLPLTAYEAHLFGRGSAESRAWLFAGLLRQLRIDAVILQPAGDAEEAWWVGILLDDGIYLFDPILGLPVPAADADALPPPSFLPTPATWAQAVADPTLLVRYRREAGLEVTDLAADQLAAVRVELIGPSTAWSTAMERLELSMAEDRGVLLYDPLHDTSAGSGLVSRVVRAGGEFWSEESITLWSYPDRVRAARAELSETQRQRLQQRLRPYLGPVEFEVQGDQISIRPPTKRLWETRVVHMSGFPERAVGSYTLIRLDATSDQALPPGDQALNDASADEANYWASHAQYGAGQYAAAVTTIERYVADGGDRSDEALALRVLCLAAQGRTAEAADAVAELPETTPGLARLRWLATRWSEPAEAT
jgi:hypothetical protein